MNRRHVLIISSYFILSDLKTTLHTTLPFHSPNFFNLHPHFPPPSSPFLLLRRRRRVKNRISCLRLPLPLLLAKDLHRRLPPTLGPLQQRRTDDDLIAHDVLVVVGVCGAVGAVETIY